MTESRTGQASAGRANDVDGEDNGSNELKVDAERLYASGTGPGALPQLGQEERKQVAERAAISAAISAAVVHETVREEGERELGKHPAALAWSSLAAGLSMGFSLVG